MLIHLSAIIYRIIVNREYLKGGLTMGFFVVLGITVFNFSSTIQNRFNEMITVVASGDTASGSTTAARVEIWNISSELIAEKPFLGHGTSNEQEVLVSAYEQEGFNNFVEKKLNAHNQFLQTGIAVGFLGMLVLILMLLIPLYFSYKHNYYLYASFILLIGFNFMTEAMLERQAGVVFYALFNSLFFMSSFERNSEKNAIKD